MLAVLRASSFRSIVKRLRRQRDDALLRLLYNTGMRAQELVDLDANHLRFSRPYSVRIYGKGMERADLPAMEERPSML